MSTEFIDAFFPYGSFVLRKNFPKAFTRLFPPALQRICTRPILSLPLVQGSAPFLVRWPSLAPLIVLGLILGLRGHFSFQTQNNWHRPPTPSLSLSFGFYALMCTAALLCHCLLPRSSDWQMALVSLDIAATGSCAFSALYACLSDELGDSLRRSWGGATAVGAAAAGAAAAGVENAGAAAQAPSGSAGSAGAAVAGGASGPAEVAVAAGGGAAAAAAAATAATAATAAAPEPAPLVQVSQPLAAGGIDSRRAAAARAKRRHVINLVTGNGLINISAFWGVRVPYMAEAIYIGMAAAAALGVGAYIVRRGMVGRQPLWFGLMLSGAALALFGIPLDAHLCTWLGPHANHVVLLFAGCDLIMYGFGRYIREDLEMRYDTPYYERRRAAATAVEKAAEGKAGGQGKGRNGMVAGAGGAGQEVRQRGR